MSLAMHQLSYLNSDFSDALHRAPSAESSYKIRNANTVSLRNEREGDKE